ncbi:hypothetical protein BASA81_009546 [Batrachochytrium salamandrivorans]|nr:hypothetical protein BASA81_009546 [Batrachochytrium salamandrivorans]
MDLLPQLLDFTRLQGDRSQIYSKLERGFDLFISGHASRDDFITLTNSAKDSFVLISKRIQEIEASLKSDQLPQNDAVAIIRQIQSLEQTKLAKTVQRQMLLTESTFGDRDFSSELPECEDILKSTVEKINKALEELHSEMAEM